jgi:hypothetical protein
MRVGLTLCAGGDAGGGADEHHIADEGAGAVGDAGVIYVGRTAPKASGKLGVGFSEAGFEEGEGEKGAGEAVG